MALVADSRRGTCEPDHYRAFTRDTRSVPLGVIAVVISMTLNLLALASTVSMLADGVKARGTVFQNTQGGRPTAV
jgi:hypothetical protein